MRRFLGTVLVGIGALCLVAAVGVPLYLAPAVTKLPNDLQACPPPPAAAPSGCVEPSVAEATGATYLQKSDLTIKTGMLRSTTEVIPQPKTTADQQKAGKLDDNATVWDVYSTVQDAQGSVVSASSTELALDRVTGAAINWDGQWIDDSQSKDTAIRYSDQVYKFPFGTEKVDTYKIYDTDLRQALPVHFVSVETIEGVEVYHFEQQFADQDLSVAASDLAALVGAFGPGATTGRVTYSNTREVWVEPTTGAYIKVREQPKQVFQPDVGTPTVLLQADFVYTPQTISASAASAKSNRTQLQIVHLWGPIVLGVLAIVLLLAGFLMARRRPDDGEPGSWDSQLPDPRHRLRGDGQAGEPADEPTATSWSGSH